MTILRINELNSQGRNNINSITNNSTTTYTFVLDHSYSHNQFIQIWRLWSVHKLLKNSSEHLLWKPQHNSWFFEIRTKIYAYNDRIHVLNIEQLNVTVFSIIHIRLSPNVYAYFIWFAWTFIWFAWNFSFFPQ